MLQYESFNENGGKKARILHRLIKVRLFVSVLIYKGLHIRICIHMIVNILNNHPYPYLHKFGQLWIIMRQ